MKTFVLIIIALMTLGTSVRAQETEDSTALYSYCLNEYVSINIGVPVVRSVYGGTRILVDFVGNWDEEMIGAFQYACELWEEALPTCFPIRIKAEMSDVNSSAFNNSSDFNKISKIRTDYREHRDWEYETIHLYGSCSSTPQIKGAMFCELAADYGTTMYLPIGRDSSIVDSAVFTKPDITLIYYKDYIKNNCSFAIDGTVQDNKYDFVTIAMRDIGKGLGIAWSFPNLHRINKKLIRPFDNFILDRIFVENNIQQTLQNAQQDSVVIISDNYHTGRSSWSVYAPRAWTPGISLNYFTGNDNKKISKLLTYNFGRESVIHDISCSDTYNFFTDILKWNADIPVGSNSSSFSQSGSTTSDVVPYHGTISFNARHSSPTFANSSHVNNIVTDSVGRALAPIQRRRTAYPDSIASFLEMYLPDYLPNGSFLQDGRSIALLLKDGSWDIVYDDIDWDYDLEIGTEELNLHHQLDEYACTIDGYLRCRVTFVQSRTSSRKDIRTYYLLLDHLPQKVNMKMSRVRPVEDEDDYYRDVEIGLSGLEGANRIIVSQLDEGCIVPFMYEVFDFKKGYFVATVDVDYSSTFIITAYNQNGSTTSQTYMVGPLSPTPVSLYFSVSNDRIEIRNATRRRSERSLVQSAEIAPLPLARTYTSKSQKVSANNNCIDISTLKKGYYVLTVKDFKNGVHTFKFHKK